MRSLYDKIIDLMGSFHDDQKFDLLAVSLQTVPRVESIEDDLLFEFDDYGFGLVEKNETGIWMAAFSIFNQAVVQGLVKPFGAELAFGISHSDSVEVITNKIGLAPVFNKRSLKTGWNTTNYDTGEHTLKFQFDEHGKLLTLTVYKNVLLPPGMKQLINRVT